MCDKIIWYECVPFWLQLIIPALIVIAAVVIAQYIFNLNARKRENRERRLKYIEGMLVLIGGINSKTSDFILAKTVENMLIIYQAISSNINNLVVIAPLYSSEEVIDKILDCLTELEGIKEKRLKYAEDGFVKAYASYESGADIVFDPDWGKLTGAYSDLLRLLQEEHKIIENEH